MTYEFFHKACLEDGLPLRAIDILWRNRPDYVDGIVEDDDSRADLKITNEECLPQILELDKVVGDLEAAITGGATA